MFYEVESGQIKSNQLMSMKWLEIIGQEKTRQSISAIHHCFQLSVVMGEGREGKIRLDK